MINIKYFFIKVNSFDRPRILLFFVLSIASVFFQYSALAGIYGFIKLKIEGVDFIQFINVLSLDFFSFVLFSNISKVDLNNTSVYFILIFIFFYSLSGILSLFGRSVSAKIVHDYRRELYDDARARGLLNNMLYKEALSTYLTLHRRYLQMIPPLFVVFLGMVVFYIVNIRLFFMFSGGFVFIVFFVFIFFSFVSIKDKHVQTKDNHHKNYSKEYLSYMSKFSSQVLSVFLFGAVLFFALEEAISIEKLLVIVIVGRIVLGNLVNVIYPLIEISGNFNCVSKVKNEIL